MQSFISPIYLASQRSRVRVTSLGDSRSFRLKKSPSNAFGAISAVGRKFDGATPQSLNKSINCVVSLGNPRIELVYPLFAVGCSILWVLSRKSREGMLRNEAAAYKTEIKVECIHPKLCYSDAQCMLRRYQSDVDCTLGCSVYRSANYSSPRTSWLMTFL